MLAYGNLMRRLSRSFALPDFAVGFRMFAKIGATHLTTLLRNNHRTAGPPTKPVLPHPDENPLPLVAKLCQEINDLWD